MRAAARAEAAAQSPVEKEWRPVAEPKEPNAEPLTDEEYEALRALDRKALAVFANLHRRAAQSTKEGCDLMYILEKLSVIDYDLMDKLIDAYHTAYYPAEDVSSENVTVAPPIYCVIQWYRPRP